MLNIVIPMAGRGSRFSNAGYILPKPLIQLRDRAMIEVVIENLRPRSSHRFIFICLDEHIKKWQVDEKLRKWAPDCEVVVVDRVTEGAACTVLLARPFINNSDPLMIANSDQWINTDINEYLTRFEDLGHLGGFIMTMKANDPKWSFVRFDDSKDVIEVVEKEVVSSDATVGIYNFRKGSDYVRAAEIMIHKGLKVNNEFYVAPVYNELIRMGKKVGAYDIGSVGEGMFGLGIPEDLDAFVRHPVAQMVLR
ncbi:MAG: glycosyltransferase family 2 protein [Candidatus Manganitrophus sp.]|nr:glycosyltransferase family 2 protein [Candidatus Manganitrophus sp.]MDC4226499.1 glycosyltransferase family 2 protein [Candidatus Manganitrophus sp.]WDT72311.1 MAG: glycosyltransferase family 2 protein [Candidatus Manganitrophus sp.]WDT75447.1 MAG: glycosyltransferase family 2 protein [Candidatus Manganitrophus sp.]WDT80254.1 MAG: glycosyltransferase family 2 protein [Candidatus Manganitrophus sp.]